MESSAPVLFETRTPAAFQLFSSEGRNRQNHVSCDPHLQILCDRAGWNTAISIYTSQKVGHTHFDFV